MSSSRTDAQTEVRTERITYNWLIKKFDLLPQRVGEKISSPWFYSRDNSEKWRLEFYPCGEHEIFSEGIDYVGLYFSRNSQGKSPIKVSTQWKLSRSNIILKNILVTQEYKPQETFGYSQFLQRSKLIVTNSSEENQFTISCLIDIPVEVVTSSFDAAILASRTNQLSDDFRLLFENPVFSDFTIIVGDQKFPTHRYILARRSPVFAAMFEHKDMEENRTKEVKIKNIEPDVIKGMLEFIYTDQVTNIKELASGLLEAANKYDLRKLSIMCEETLFRGINKENAVEVLLFADLHRADTLKKCVMKYIVDHASELIESDNWKEATWNLELLLELFHQLILSQVANNEESQSSKA